MEALPGIVRHRRECSTQNIKDCTEKHGQSVAGVLNLSVEAMQVSVIIPVYNAAGTVAQAAASALEQPETGQVILIEDGSTDDSLAVCQNLASRHPKVVVLRHPDGKNHGIAASRNLGIRSAGCLYIAFLDADDFYLPGRFRTARRIMAADPHVDGVYDAVGTLYENEQCAQWYREQQSPDLLTVRKPTDPAELFSTLLSDDGGFFLTDGLVVRSRIFERTGLFDTALPICEDTALWLKMAALGRLESGGLTEPVAMHRVHGSNITYQNRHLAGYHAIRMVRSLLVWARKEKLGSSRMLLLLDFLFNLHLGELASQSPYIRRKMKELVLFAWFAMRYPRILRSRHYRRVLAAAVGVKRVMSLFGQHPQALSLR